MQYLKIKDAITEQIETGSLEAKQKLPSERQLAELFQTTRVTLREALSLLEAEGKVYREDRRGWFISPKPLRYDPNQAVSFSNMALAQDREPVIQLLSAKSILADKQASTLLNLSSFSHVHTIERLYFLENRPVAFVINYVRADIFPALIEHDLSLSLMDIYRQHYDQACQSLRYRLMASSLMDKTAQVLRATSGSPATLIEKTRYNASGVMLDVTLEYWRHDAMFIESTSEW